ncbi:MAG: divalent-cation tolerance protein CutA [Lysobacter sp.]|nr:divalent-cation tolerance protein CutA [Lysobacter sp.]
MSAGTPDEVLVCLCTCPDPATARALGRALVEERLAACVQLLPGIESVYRWDGAVESATETLLILKTTRARHEALQARLVALHPYEVPELVAWPAVAGLPAYLHWVADSTRADDDRARDASPATD